MSWLSEAKTYASFFTLSGSAPPEPARFPLSDRLLAARAAGFDGVGLMSDDVSALEAVDEPATLARLASENEMSVPELEFLPFWHRDGEEGELSQLQEERIYALAETFGSRQMNIGMIDPPSAMPPVAELAERLAALCRRADRHGLLVALEPMAPWCLKTPAQAWEIVQASGAGNAGILIDAYHFFRGSGDLEALRAIPASAIVGVQINDADAELHGSPEEDCVDFRLVPGTGTADVPALLLTLQEMGVNDVPIGVEVMSAQLRDRPLAEIAARVGSATRSLLDQVAGAPPSDPGGAPASPPHQGAIR